MLCKLEKISQQIIFRRQLDFNISTFHIPLLGSMPMSMYVL